MSVVNSSYSVQPGPNVPVSAEQVLSMSWKPIMTCVNSSLNYPSRSVVPCFHRVVMPTVVSPRSPCGASHFMGGDRELDSDGQRPDGG
jgi:hypothetical protein